MDQHSVTLRWRVEQLNALIARMEEAHPADVPTADLEEGARNLLAAAALAEELKEA